MKPLSLGVALFGLLALVLAEAGEDVTTAVLGAACRRHRRNASSGA
jgi:hypothetical protein